MDIKKIDLAARASKYSTKEVTFLGLSLILLGIILVFGKPPEEIERVDLIKSSSFAQEPVATERFNKESTNAVSPVRITIPSLSIDLPVARSEIIEGYWEIFDDKAGWGVGSASPGDTGNQVIFAHARDGLFLPLLDIEVGTRVTVFTEEDWYDYEIVEIKEVYPDYTEVIEPTEDETLTLYTCSGFNDEKRLIATAKRTNDTTSI